MAQDFTMYVGTVGGGLSVSADGGETFKHIGMGGTLPPSECDVRAITVYPNDPDRVLAGTNAGIYRSESRGATWELLDSPMNTEWPARSNRASDEWPLQNVDLIPGNVGSISNEVLSSPVEIKVGTGELLLCVQRDSASGTIKVVR